MCLCRDTSRGGKPTVWSEYCSYVDSWLLLKNTQLNTPTLRAFSFMALTLVKYWFDSYKVSGVHTERGVAGNATAGGGGGGADLCCIYITYLLHCRALNPNNEINPAHLQCVRNKLNVKKKYESPLGKNVSVTTCRPIRRMLRASLLLS